MEIQKRLQTIKDYENFIALPENRERRFELIHGEIIEYIPSEEHGYLTGIIATEINIWLKTNPVGRLSIETRHQLAGDEHNARIPNLSFTRNERLLPIVKKGAVPYMPDLAVEIQSPDDSVKEMREKAN